MASDPRPNMQVPPIGAISAQLSNAKRLLALGGWIFLLMGLVHSGATICDLVRPSFLMPLDVNLLALMADAPIGLTSRTAVLPTYLGFSFSHGLGMCILGLVAILIAARDFGLVLRFRSLLPLLILASLFYITISITFWFYAPALSSGIACGCFLLSYLTVSLEGTRN